MLQGKEKRGTGIVIWRLTHSLTTYPLIPKKVFSYEGKEGLEILRVVS